MNSVAALRRLNDGNGNFAALLDHVKNESGIQIIPARFSRRCEASSEDGAEPANGPRAARWLFLFMRAQ